MKATEVYRVAASQLGAPLAAHGFKKLRSSRLAYQRPAAGSTWQTVWFQCDKYGWDAFSGSRFFVSFTVTDSPAYDVGGRHAEGLFFFLNDAELAGAQDFRDAVVARIPEPPASYFETLQAHFDKHAPVHAAEMMAAVRAQFEPESVPYQCHQDVGMRYWLPADVTWWATLITRVLPRAIAQMDAWSAEVIRET